jgi:hypothetical protein
MAANPNWARWIFGSIATEMKQLAQAHDLAALIEHLDERTDDFIKSPDRVEIRITGPFDSELSKGYHRLNVDINVLLTSIYGGEKKNPYDILTFAGLFQKRMGEPFPIYNYGKGVGEYNDPNLLTQEQVFLGCLLPLGGKGNAIKVFNFGQTDKVDKLKQSVVDGRYTIDLEE